MIKKRGNKAKIWQKTWGGGQKIPFSLRPDNLNMSLSWGTQEGKSLKYPEKERKKRKKITVISTESFNL